MIDLEMIIPSHPRAVVTVRMSSDLYERLVEGAWEHCTSMNVLCIAALEEALRQLEAAKNQIEVIA